MKKKADLLSLSNLNKYKNKNKNKNGTNKNMVNNHIIRSKHGKFINLMDHPILEINSGVFIKPSGNVLQVKTLNKVVCKINNIPIKKGFIEKLIGELPPRKKGVYYLVNTMVLKKILLDHKDRKDFLSPGPAYTDPTTRKKSGCNNFFCDYDEVTGNSLIDTDLSEKDVILFNEFLEWKKEKEINEKK